MSDSMRESVSERKEREAAEALHIVDGNAKRGMRRPFYRIIPHCALKRWAEALTEGHDKYSEGVFTSNWKGGQEQFFAEAFDHVIEHLYAWYTSLNDPGLAEMMETEDEDHLGHALAGLGFLAYGEEMGWFSEAADKNAPQLHVANTPDGEVLLPEKLAKEKVEIPKATPPPDIWVEVEDKKSQTVVGLIEKGKKLIGG